MVQVVRSVLVLILLHAGAAAATQQYSAQLGLVPWKAAGQIDNLAARELFERFLSEESDVQIVEFERLWLPGRYWAAAEVLSVAGNAGPDMMRVKFSELGSYVRSGLVIPVDQYFNKWAERDRFPESLNRSLMIEGSHWGAVSDVDFALLAGNREVFSSLGQGPEAMPKNWEDLVHMASLLRLPGKRYGLVLPSGKPLAYLWLALARQAGGEGVARVGPEGVEADLLLDPAQRAGAFLARIGESLRQAGRDTFCLVEEPEAIRQMLVEGKAAMALVSYRDMDVELFDVGTRGKGEFALQPVRPHLAPVPGAFRDEPLAYAVDGLCGVLPAYIGTDERKIHVWQFHTKATPATADFDREWLKMAPAKQAHVASIFKMRYPDHPAVAHLPAAWEKAFSGAMRSIEAMPPDAQFEELATMLGEKFTLLLREGGNPGAMLFAVQHDFDFKIHNKFRLTSKVWLTIGWLCLLCLLGLLVFGIWRLVTGLREEIANFRNAPAEAAPPARLLAGIVLFLPAALLAAIFGVVPLLNGLRMSFFSHVLKDGGSFVGVANYLDVVTNANTHLALTNTAAYLGLSFVMAFVAPFVLALVLASFPRGQFLIRSAFFLPAIASAVVLAILWQQMYDISGPFNDLATLLGFGPHEWLKEPGLAMFSVVLAQSWCFLGISGLTYIAGLSVIPEEQYEDAEIMGAGLVDRFLQVTYPNIRPLLGINLVGWLINTARTAEHVFLMTGGGPDKATHVIGLEIFDQAYLRIRFGYAMAEVWLLVAVILIFSIYQMRAIRSGQIQVRAD